MCVYICVTVCMNTYVCVIVYNMCVYLSIYLYIYIETETETPRNRQRQNREK